jgi:hypothetical protein
MVFEYSSLNYSSNHPRAAPFQPEEARYPIGIIVFLGLDRNCQIMVFWSRNNETL